MARTLHLLLVPLFLALCLAGLVFLAPLPAFAQSETPQDLVNAVNALRTSQGLAPYLVDTGLMLVAQSHSEWQSSIRTSTHLHADGSTPPDLGLVENVAGGDTGYVTVDVVVHEIWSDEGHRKTLTGYPSGWVGAGIAEANGALYYTLLLLPGDTAAEVTPTPPAPGTLAAPLAEAGASAAALQTGDTPAAPGFTPFTTSTPGADGAIRHTVQPGEALWSIAISYGVTIAEIQEYNGLPADSTVLQVGQILIIRPAGAAAPTSTSPPTAAPGADPALALTPAAPGVQDTPAAAGEAAPTAASASPPPTAASAASQSAALSETPAPTTSPTPAAPPRPWESPYFLPIAAILLGISGLVIILLSYTKR